jgi:AAA domain
MIHPLFSKAIFVETAFEKRFQARRRSAWHQRSWPGIGADPGAGKPMGLRDLIKTAGSKAVLAITAPKNNADEMALGNQLFTALGMPLRGRWSDRKPRLMGHLHQYGTECLMIDDAPDLSLEHLMVIKDLTDQGRLQYDHPLGLCLVAAGRGNTIPLKETLDQPEPTGLPFRRRLDKLEPFCRVASHPSEEVREILAALETVYQPLFPQLNLRQWAGSIYTWLTQPVLDPTHSGRVTMDDLMKLVTTGLEWTYEAGEPEVQTGTRAQAAHLLVLRRDTLQILEGAGPSVDGARPDGAASGSAHGTEQPQDTVRAHGPQHTTNTVAAQVPPHQSPKCTCAGVVAIDLTRFADSGVALVECPACARRRSLSPHQGVLRFPSHDRRKMQTAVTGVRWAAKGKTDWGVVGGEQK